MVFHLQGLFMAVHQRPLFSNFQDKRHSFIVSTVTMWLHITQLSQQPGFSSLPRLHTPQVILLNTCKDKNDLCYIKAFFSFKERC